MPDLHQVQTQLNSDPQEKQKFLQDPVQYLNGKGVNLPPAAAQQLRNQLQQNPALDAQAAWNVGVTVGN
jgi:hypothetical protein